MAVNLRLDLAKSIAPSTFPEDVLKTLFDGVFEALEEKALSNLQDPLKDRLWSHVSGEPLRALKTHFYHQIATRILGHLTEPEVETALKTHQATGEISGEIGGIIHRTFTIEEERVKTSTMNKAQSLLPEMIAAACSELTRLGEVLPPRGK